VTVDANGLKLEALVLRDGNLKPGEDCVATLPADQIRLLPVE